MRRSTENGRTTDRTGRTRKALGVSQVRAHRADGYKDSRLPEGRNLAGVTQQKAEEL